MRIQLLLSAIVLVATMSGTDLYGQFILNTGETDCLWDDPTSEGCPDRASVVCPMNAKCSNTSSVGCFDRGTDDFILYSRMVFNNGELQVRKWTAPPAGSTGQTALLVQTYVCYRESACVCTQLEGGDVCIAQESSSSYVLREYRKDPKKPCTKGGVLE